MESPNPLTRYLFHSKKRPLGVRVCVRGVNFILAFALAFLWVPLPIRLPPGAPQPVRVATEALQELVEPKEAEAAPTKAVQQGTASLGGVATTEVAAITEVDVQKAVIFTTPRPNSDKFEAGLVTAEFNSPTELFFARNFADKTNTLEWKVIEFSDEVFVQGGLTRITAGTASRTVSLGSSFDPATTFAKIHFSTPPPNKVGDLGITAELVPPNQLVLTRVTNNNNGEVFISYQVVEMQTDVNVYHGTTTVTAGNLFADATAPTDFTAIVPTKAFLIVTERATNATLDYNNVKVMGEIVDGSTVRFTRKASSGGPIVAWFIVEFTDGTTVQKNTLLNWTGTGIDIGLSPIDRDRSFPVISANTSEAVKGWAHLIGAELTVTPANNLHLDRTGILSSDVGWFVIELPVLPDSPGGDDQPG